MNTWYLSWWSLVHFLLEADDGRRADGFRRVFAGDGSLQEFEREFGAVESLEPQWYDWLLQQQAEMRAQKKPADR